MKKEEFKKITELIANGESLVELFHKGQASEDELKKIKAIFEDNYKNTTDNGLCHEFKNLKVKFKLTEIEYNILKGLTLFYRNTAGDIFTENGNGYIPVDKLISYLTIDSRDKIVEENKILNSLDEKSNLRIYNLINIKVNGDIERDIKYSKVKISPYLYRYLMGEKIITEGESVSQIEVSPFEDLILPEKTMEKLSMIENYCFKVINQKSEEEKSIIENIIVLKGEKGTGKKTALSALAEKHQKKTLILDVERLLSEIAPTEYRHIKESLSTFLRDALYFDYIPHLDNMEILEGREISNSILTICESFSKDFNIPVLLSYNLKNDPIRIKNINYHEVEFKSADVKLREKIWDYYLKEYKVTSEIDTPLLASMFNITPAIIERSVKLALYDSFNNAENLSDKEIIKSCKALCHSNLHRLAEKIKSHYQWDDLILEDDSRAQLKEIVLQVKFRSLVNSEWTMGDKHNTGKGLHALFHGSSGTGKTMAAGIIAKELNLDLYRVDLSTVIDKYIGETEKNLNKIFTEAETSNGILFFDEADAIFGKRSDVNSSNDRHANVEVGYLLQRMEAYDGIVILATNLRNNMDKAFERRLDFTVNFKRPGKDERKILWNRVFPAKVPLADDIDFDFMADKFDFTGANIRNIATRAAYYGADTVDKKITMEHIIKSTRREFQKMGQASMKTLFDPYFHYIADDKAKARGWV